MKHYTAQSIKLQGKLERGKVHLYLVFHYGYRQERLGPNGEVLTTYHPLKVSTGQTVHPSNWQDGDFTATFRKRHGAVANQITAAVEDQRQKLFAAYTALMEKLAHLPSPDQITDLFRGRKAQATKVRLADFIRQHSDSDSCPNKGSKKKFRTLAKLVEALEALRQAGALRDHMQGRGPLFLHTFNEADWNDFATMLRRATCYVGRPFVRYGVERLQFKSGDEHSVYSSNTVEKYQKNLRTILQAARKQKLPLSVDMDLLEKVKYHHETKEFLTVHEINTLYTARLENEALDNVRRLFLLQLFCGVRVGGLKILLQKPIVLVRGNELTFRAIKFVDPKTGANMCIPLFAPSLDILCNDRPTWVSEQKQNTHIKEICRLLGIDRIQCVKTIRADGFRETRDVPIWSRTSTHTARRSAKTALEGPPLFCSRRIVAAFQGHSVNDGAADNAYFCLNEDQYAEALLQQVSVNAHKLPFPMIPEAAVSVKRA